MNIDRHNYEMYFLLYVDNELSAEERNAVEKFVAENIDLKTELELLKQTALPADEIIFSAKYDLYKTELSPDLLQEQLLMHLDNELEPSQMNSLAAEITANNDLQREWNILQQTKLDPNEEVVFENKQSLYRYERDKVVTMRYWRVAAAVLLIGAALFIGVTKFSASKKTDDVAVTSPGQQSTKKANTTAQTNTAAEKNDLPVKPKEENIASFQPAVDNKTTKELSNLQQKDKIASTSVKNKNNASINNDVAPVTKKENNNEIVKKEVNKKETNNLPKPYYENINNDPGNKTASSTVKDNINDLQKQNEDLKPSDKIIAETKAKEPKYPVEEPVLTETNNVYAKQAVLNETVSETGNNSVFLISEEKVNRSKIGGFVRKLKRVLTRNANIKAGNSIKVAGFEIATK
ncbi:MAG: hypothetical protein QM737_11165 [Ferruginibacter sp.]